MKTTTQHKTHYKNTHLGSSLFFFAGFYVKIATCKALQRKTDNSLLVFASALQKK